MRLLPPLIFCLMLASASVRAQVDGEPRRQAAPPGGNPTSAADPAEGRQNQKIERIRTEDAGSRIDELRVGGETQQITVQPKAPVPPYEVKPSEGARGKAPSSGSGETNGSRVWNLFKF